MFHDTFDDTFDDTVDDKVDDKSDVTDARWMQVRVPATSPSLPTASLLL